MALAALRVFLRTPGGKFWVASLVIFASSIAVQRYFAAGAQKVERYALQWDQQSWVSVASASDIVFFRAEVNLAHTPRAAHVQIAATDMFVLYVNGERVAEKQWVSAIVTSIEDIGSLLARGKNVVGIEVRRRAAGGPLALNAEIEVQGRPSERKLFSTAAGWRFATLSSAGREWATPGYDASGWQPAVVSPKLGRSLYSEVPRDLYRFGAPAWVWPYHGGPTARLERTFLVESEPSSGVWLGIAVTGSFRAIVNGTALKERFGTEKTIEVVDLSPLAHRGENHLAIEVTSESASFRRIGIVGITIDRSRIQDFSPPVSWRVAADAGRGLEAIEGPPVSMEFSGARPTIHPISLEELGHGGQARRLGVALFWWMGAFLANIALIFVVLPRSPSTAHAGFSLSLPIWSGTLFVLIVFALGTDFRLPPGPVFSAVWVVFAVGFVGVLQWVFANVLGRGQA